MRVDTIRINVTVYYFSKQEKDELINIGVWTLLNNNLKKYERIEVDE